MSTSRLMVARKTVAGLIKQYAPPGAIQTAAHQRMLLACAELEAAAIESGAAEREKTLLEALANQENVTLTGDVDSEAMAKNLREAQANGTSGDIALGRDKEAMKVEAAMQPKYDSALPPSDATVTHVALTNGTADVFKQQPGFTPPPQEYTPPAPTVPDVAQAAVDVNEKPSRKRK